MWIVIYKRYGEWRSTACDFKSRETAEEHIRRYMSGEGNSHYERATPFFIDADKEARHD